MTLAVYQKRRAFPQEEMYGLTSQLCRAAVLRLGPKGGGKVKMLR